jgi:hypothetical protein
MSVTDGTFVCGRCGDWRTSCSLCQDAPIVIDMRRSLAYEREQEIKADQEEREQEQCIRRSSEKRQGF